MTPIDTALTIVGGGPAAMAAARAYHDAGGPGPVALIADEERLPYQRPPLTKELLQGHMDEAELPLEDDGWPAAHGVSFLAARAVALDDHARTVTLDDGRQLRFGTCLLAPGSAPVRLPVPGADDPGVLVVRTLDHVRELTRRLHADAAVTVIGSGFIGCEIAASLRRRGHPVTLVSDEAAPQAARLGHEVAERLRGWLDDEGVRLLLGRPVDEVRRQGSTLRVVAGDAHADAGVVVMAAGARPRTELTRGTRLSVRSGAIVVDAHMRTSVPGVLAAGDAAYAAHAVAGRPVHVEHWGDALAQGDVAGRTAAGADAVWETVPGFWSTIGDRTLKHAAWGDGRDAVQVTDHGGGAFTARYWSEDALVGVLTHDRDEDYEQDRDRIAHDARLTTHPPGE